MRLAYKYPNGPYWTDIFRVMEQKLAQNDLRSDKKRFKDQTVA